MIGGTISRYFVSGTISGKIPSNAIVTGAYVFGSNTSTTANFFGLITIGQDGNYWTSPESYYFANSSTASRRYKVNGSNAGTGHLGQDNFKLPVTNTKTTNNGGYSVYIFYLSN